MSKKREYDKEYKVQAVKFAKNLGSAKTAELDIGCGERSPEEALSIAKEELFYHRGRKTEHYKMEELKFMVWRYFMSYWSNRRICSSIGGLSPAVKRQRFYAAVAVARFAS